jgi:hypothetical protein
MIYLNPGAVGRNMKDAHATVSTRANETVGLSQVPALVSQSWDRTLRELHEPTASGQRDGAGHLPVSIS